VATELLPILPGTLPPNICYDTEQERIVAFAGQMWAQLSGQAFYNYGDTKPAPEFNGYPWLRQQDMRWYYFAGVWISPNPEQSPYARRLFMGTTVNLQTYDGGDTNAPSDRSGPMWEVDTAFDGRSPMGVGTIPLSDPSKSLALGEQYGEGSHTQTEDEMPEHAHNVQYATSDTGDGFPTVSNGTTAVLNYNTDEKGGSEPMNWVHPVVGIYIIKRTARIYYAVA
jgi:hypothetical protein